jgi:hypothetical protein
MAGIRRKNSHYAELGIRDISILEIHETRVFVSAGQARACFTGPADQLLGGQQIESSHAYWMWPDTGTACDRAATERKTRSAANTAAANYPAIAFPARLKRRSTPYRAQFTPQTQQCIPEL